MQSNQNTIAIQALGDFTAQVGPTVGAGYHGALITHPRVSRTDLMVVALEMGDVTVEEGVALALSSGLNLVDEHALSDQTMAGYGKDLARFARYQQARRPVRSVRECSREDVLAFIHAPILRHEAMQMPEATTRARRFASVAFLFAQLRQLGLYDGDPLLDVERPRRDSVAYRRLTDQEIDQCRFHAGRTRHDTRGTCAWGLAECTATTSEIPTTLVIDVDRPNRRVWLNGGARNVARWAEPTDWAWSAILARIADLGAVDPSTPLVYQGKRDGESPQASASKAISDTITRAGLGGDRSARPLSVPAWRGWQIYVETFDLVSVRQALGVRSLDRTAEIIGAPIGWSDLPPAHRRGDR